MSQNPLPAYVAVKSGAMAPLNLDPVTGALLVASEGASIQASLSASSGNVAAASAVATLAAAAGKTTYITGFTATGLGATAAGVSLLTVTGLLGGTQTYVVPVPAGATLGIAPLRVTFIPPLPASAVNTAIVVTMPTLGAGNTNAAVVATGFQQ